jgi:hypothetical protein
MKNGTMSPDSCPQNARMEIFPSALLKCLISINWVAKVGFDRTVGGGFGGGKVPGDLIGGSDDWVGGKIIFVRLRLNNI